MSLVLIFLRARNYLATSGAESNVQGTMPEDLQPPGARGRRWCGGRRGAIWATKLSPNMPPARRCFRRSASRRRTRRWCPGSGGRRRSWGASYKGADGGRVWQSSQCMYVCPRGRAGQCASAQT